MKQTKQHGGARPGSGRPKGKLKKALGLRVPVEYHEHLTGVVKKELTKLLKQKA